MTLLKKILSIIFLSSFFLGIQINPIQCMECQSSSTLTSLKAFLEQCETLSLEDIRSTIQEIAYELKEHPNESLKNYLQLLLVTNNKTELCYFIQGLSTAIYSILKSN
jgi:hypothetical protein